MGSSIYLYCCFCSHTNFFFWKASNLSWYLLRLKVSLSGQILMVCDVFLFNPPLKPALKKDLKDTFPVEYSDIFIRYNLCFLTSLIHSHHWDKKRSGHSLWYGLSVMGFSKFIPLLKLGEPVQKGNTVFCDFKFNFMWERLRGFYGSDLMHIIKFYNIWLD